MIYENELQSLVVDLSFGMTQNSNSTTYHNLSSNMSLKKFFKNYTTLSRNKNIKKTLVGVLHQHYYI